MPRMRLPPGKAQPRRQGPPRGGGQLDEFLGRPGSVPRSPTHQRRLEGARGALSVTGGAGGAIGRGRALTPERWFLSVCYPSPLIVALILAPALALPLAAAQAAWRRDAKLAAMTPVALAMAANLAG